MDIIIYTLIFVTYSKVRLNTSNYLNTQLNFITMEEKETTVATVATTDNYANRSNRYPSPVKGKPKHRANYLANDNWAKRVPEHIRNLVYQIRNNTEIRRFTALGIINYLLSKGEIKGEKRYVNFLWDKFTVKCDGLCRDFLYTEPFFLNAFAASFASFAANAQRILNAFCIAEKNAGANEVLKQEEIDALAEINEAHQEEVISSVGDDENKGE